MKTQINLSKNVLGLSALLAVFVSFSGVALATPETPINAANVQTQNDRDGFGCVVRESADDSYMFDPSCQSHVVSKSDRNGDFKFYRYQDKGELQVGQVAPKRTVRIPIVIGSCSGTEVVTPSGQYSSDLTCKF